MQPENAELKTDGISPKAVLAFLFPLIAALIAAIASWVATGDFNDAEVRTAVGGVASSAIAAIGAYVGKPGGVTLR